VDAWSQAACRFKTHSSGIADYYREEALPLMAEPRFLAVADEQFKIRTTQEALASATALSPTLKRNKGIVDLISRAITLGTVELLDPPISTGEARNKDVAVAVSTQSTTVRSVDATVVNAALRIKSKYPGGDLWVSMYNEDSCKLANQLGLRAARHNIIGFSIKNATKHVELGPKIEEFIKDRIAYMILGTASLLLLVAVTSVGVFSYGHILPGDWLALRTFSSWAWGRALLVQVKVYCSLCSR
jgi:hypothetical protein